MLDVHPPHEPVHGWRDFLLHLFTITIGLLIALSLEGCVEWQHHRHLVHEAERSLSHEIRSNAENLQSTRDDIHKQQADLKHDATILKGLVATGKLPPHSSMEINFKIHRFDDVSWRTAQSTGALSYMPYASAQEFADIYSTQQSLDASQDVAARDAILSLAPFANAEKNDPDPTREQGSTIKERIDVLQGQLLLVNALVTDLDAQYKKFLAAHP